MYVLNYIIHIFNPNRKLIDVVYLFFAVIPIAMHGAQRPSALNFECMVSYAHHKQYPDTPILAEN